MSDTNTEATPTPSPSTSSSPSSTTKWKELPSTMSTRHRHGVGLSINDHQFLALGGWDDNWKRLATGEYYDAATAKWEKFLVDMPKGCYGFGAAIVGSRLFVLGGKDANDKRLADVNSTNVSCGDLSSMKGRNWKTDHAPLPKEGSDFACALHGKCVYVFGGFNGSNNNYKLVDMAFRYDTESNQKQSMDGPAGHPCYRNSE